MTGITRIRERPVQQVASVVPPAKSKAPEPAQSKRLLDLSVEEGMVEWHTTVYGLEREGREKIKVPAFPGEPAVIRVAGSVTKNLGDYNSARVEVAVQIPCLPVESDLDRAYEFASTKVDEYTRKEMVIAGMIPEEGAQ